MEHKRLVRFVVMAMVFATSCADYTGFLEKYGYLPKGGSNRGDDRSPEDINTAIRQFQLFAGLEVTGIFDKETQAKMKESRCGVKDVMNDETPPGMPANLRQRSDRWPKLNLTWTVKQFSKTSTMSVNRQLFAIREGFRRWEEVSALRFRELPHPTTQKADIELSFETFEHGDRDPFDGKGNTLAHAYGPGDGKTHFDDDEEWTEGVDRGTNLEYVATHEIGHALGLYHMPGIDPVMAPYVSRYKPNFKLHRYDIIEIQRRYGQPKVVLASSTVLAFCGAVYETINAALRIDKKADYIFVDRKKVISGFSGRKTLVSRMFRGGPNSVDAAAFSQMTNTIYLFKSQKVWAFTMTSPDRFVRKTGFPKEIKNSKIKKPEAAIRVNDKNGMENILLIKDGYMYVWIPYHDKLAPGIGLAVNELFARIPKHLDAAISEENVVNFIAKNKFYTSKPISRITSKRSIPIQRLLKCTR